MSYEAEHLREQHRVTYKDLSIWLHNFRIDLLRDHHLTIEFHGRLKSIQSIAKHLEKNESAESIEDVVGFRITNPWTKHLHTISDIICSKLNIIKSWETERGRVIYLIGKSEGNVLFEIQLWTSLMYHCFEFEHDIVYKPSKPSDPSDSVTKELEKKSKQLRTDEHKLQDLIDRYVLVPYKFQS